MIISLNAVGDAPLLKQKVFKTNATKNFASVLTHICSQLKYDPAKDPLVLHLPACQLATVSEPLEVVLQYVFCNKSFIPCPDDTIGELATVKTLRRPALAYCDASAVQTHCPLMLQNYHSDGRLQLYYATNAAWG